MHMSFRNRLTVFFILLVILPVLALAFVGIQLVENAEEGRVDPGLMQSQRAASGLYRESAERAEVAAGSVGDDRGLAVAVRDGDVRAVRNQLDDLVAREEVTYVRLTLDGQPPIEAGSGVPVAPAVSRILGADGEPAGRMVLSVTSADAFANLLSRVTGHEVVITAGERTLAGTVEAEMPAEIPLQGDVELGNANYRVVSFEAPGIDGQTLRVRMLAPHDELSDTVSRNATGIGLLLLAFLICALAFALTAARSLQSQIGRLLEGARQIGKGDFSVEIPTEGNDEFAELGTEFNSMARQLEGRLEELQLERARLQETVRRVGESLGKGLDRDALLGIVVQTAVDGVGAECGRVVMRQSRNGNGSLAEAARAGDMSQLLGAVQAAEAAALQAGEAAETQISGANALARPLHAPEPEDAVLGVISIARLGQPFTERQRELFAYLTNQASISIENVDLHETIQRQAVTDELTGLFNHRRFQEVMTAEVERTRRFGQELGLIMLDIDDFKRVNDTYGHLQGDFVLREVARVLKESSREIDEPARYGGEEMAVALPQTGLEGAYEFAERVRTRIEALHLPLLDGEGALRVTASFGAASLPHSAKVDKDALVAAADAALYRAKRSGKNRTVKAE
jgi:diguanylate cyclase (GGDEF)-like protein